MQQAHGWARRVERPLVAEAAAQGRSITQEEGMIDFERGNKIRRNLKTEKPKQEVASSCTPSVPDERNRSLRCGRGCADLGEFRIT